MIVHLSLGTRKQKQKQQSTAKDKKDKKQKKLRTTVKYKADTISLQQSCGCMRCLQATSNNCISPGIFPRNKKHKNKKAAINSKINK